MLIFKNEIPNSDRRPNWNWTSFHEETRIFLVWELIDIFSA